MYVSEMDYENINESDNLTDFISRFISVQHDDLAYIQHNAHA